MNKQITRINKQKIMITGLHIDQKMNGINQPAVQFVELRMKGLHTENNTNK